MSRATQLTLWNFQLTNNSLVATTTLYIKSKIYQLRFRHSHQLHLFNLYRCHLFLPFRNRLSCRLPRLMHIMISLPRTMLRTSHTNLRVQVRATFDSRCSRFQNSSRPRSSRCLFKPRPFETRRSIPVTFRAKTFSLRYTNLQPRRLRRLTPRNSTGIPIQHNRVTGFGK
jgi:hypothetical protein